MRYDSPHALRAALEHRLLTTSQQTGLSLDRLRRRVLFQRIFGRLQVAEPGQWVLKGGMALEVRLRDAARVTKDIDLGLRGSIGDTTDLRDRLIEALSNDHLGDGFIFDVGQPAALREDRAGYLSWRVSVSAFLAGKRFGTITIDVSPRSHELRGTDRFILPNALDFAGITTPEVEVIDVNRHAAEKFHAMTRTFGDRENTRVRDLFDLVLMIEHTMLDEPAVATAARAVWRERDQTEPPDQLPRLPQSWSRRYEQLAEEGDIETQTFFEAERRVAELWNLLWLNEGER